MQFNIGKILTGLLTFFVAVIEILLGMRFVLKLLAASSNAEFTLMIYDTTESLVAPFDGVFPSFEAANFTLEISTFLAMIVYGIGGFIFIYLARNFDGLTVNPGSHPSGPPAITHNPQSQQPVQTQPMQQQPVMQQPIQTQPVQTQPIPQQPIQQPVTMPQTQSAHASTQPVASTNPVQTYPQTAEVSVVESVQQPTQPNPATSQPTTAMPTELKPDQPSPLAAEIPPSNTTSSN